MPTISLASNKSTNVRSAAEEQQARIGRALQPVRTGLRALTAVSPRLTADIAARLFTTPRRHARPDREQALLATGTPFSVPVNGALLRAWQWGQGPTVAVMHGWEGRGAQFGAFVAPLVDVGLRVVAFDAPAHGDSMGRRATPADFATALTGVAGWVGGIDAVIAHSLGAIATAIAVHRGLEVAKLAFVAPATSPAHGTRILVRALDLPPSVVDRLQQRIADDTGESWSTLAAGGLMDGIGVPLLVHHDRQDPDVPVDGAIDLCERWTPSDLVITHGLGHRRILRDEHVVSRVTGFLAPLAADRGVRKDPWRRYLEMDLSAD